MDKITMSSLTKMLRTEADAYLFLESHRWPDGPVCPHCGVIGGHYFLKPKQGLKTAEGVEARKTRSGSVTGRRLWKCKDCRKQFSVTTGTVMHGSKVDLRIWIFVIFEMASNRNGIAAREIERRYGVASRTAWHMTHRLRTAMDSNLSGPFEGVVVADETYIGGDPKNWHASDPRRKTVKTGRGTSKTAVLSLINAATGEVRSAVIPSVSRHNLRTVLAEETNMRQVTLHTDGEKTYATFYPHDLAGHESVDHGKGEYVRDGVSTNLAENFFSQLKRSLDGTHHHVSREHLHRYLAEFDFRHTTHKQTDTWRMGLLMGMLGGKRRLTYKVCAK
jgi:transposase-like protein